MYSWALKLKLDAKKEGPIHHVEYPWDYNSPGYYPGNPQENSWGGGYESYGGDANAIGAGKGLWKGGGKGGKGKGGKGKGKVCWNCGQPGHIAANCPLKGKGKGKFGYKGGKGKGKFGNKGGKGKGLYDMHVPDHSQSWPIDWVKEFNGACYLCGQWGHSAKYCPKNPNALPPPAGQSINQLQPQ